MPQVPASYAWLLQEPIAPLMVRVALDAYGTTEVAGAGSNPRILAWADEVARTTGRPYDNWAADFYNDDAIPWCGLFMAVVAVRSWQGRPERLPPRNYLAALAWADWGVPCAKTDILVGDVVVLRRQGGGHVTLAVGVTADGKEFMGLGGNQSDRVNIARFRTDRIYAVRRPPYRERPAGARRVVLTATGPLSTNER
ncbi:MAG: TIGR02594 family protein [Sphingomonadaceae bacterium]|uniref:TIGR02594 family protein n=1 Tax=Thermaurantiacus sp. TaxID=2820283 RepID=UPI00298EFDED|nr:TIGR02594 family protein [Thermaurantiacus sp.]MCS6986219.1 TIGR02594 family protein [Sphingomonadaceae bacterium]MDW8415876.1 TIGR02594 family protein [Thermaurantiacus sp.]